jgi:uncharacterized membrane protein
MLHEWFELAIFLKWIGWVFDIIRWFLFIFITPVRVNRRIFSFLQPELIEDPGDTIATHIINLWNHFSSATQHFVMWYLICYGVAKLIVSILLYKKVRWAYPLAIYFLLIFIWYQLHRYTMTHSPLLLLLSIVDLIIIYLTVTEYLRLKNKKSDI